MKLNLRIVTALFLATIFSASGQQWQNHGTGLSASGVCVVDMSFPTDNVGWAILSVFSQGTCGGQVPYIVKTGNGNNWSPRSIPMPVDVTPVCISALNSTTAWVAASNIGSNTSGIILKTTDGGNSWITQSTANFVDAARFVHFYDPNEGVAVGDSSVFTTTDGGDHWNFAGALPVPSSIIGTGTTNFLLNSYEVLGNEIWLGDSWGFFYKSNDRGQTWTLLPPLNLPHYIGIKGIAFRDSYNGMAVASYYVSGGSGGPGGNADNSLVTSDGGLTWSPVTFNLSNVNCDFQSAKYDVAYVPGTPNTYVVTSEYDASYAAFSLITNDGGLNWTVIDSTIQHTVCVFTSSTNGYSGGYIPDFSSGVFRWTGNLPTDVKENDFDKEIKLFPNPCSNRITANLRLKNFDEQYVYQVIGITGVVLIEEISGDDNSIDIDVNELPAGIYSLKLINSEGEVSVSKFVKQ